MYSSPWFNHDCEVARAEFKQRTNNFVNIGHMNCMKRKQYSKMKDGPDLSIIKKKKRLHDLASSNPKAFLQEIRKLKGSGNSSESALSICDFFSISRRYIPKIASFSKILLSSLLMKVWEIITLVLGEIALCIMILRYLMVLILALKYKRLYSNLRETKVRDLICFLRHYS